eukprot:scaffold666_cov332-Prasinococcus_capsulatus_cf.AAC.14
MASTPGLRSSPWVSRATPCVLLRVGMLALLATRAERPCALCTRGPAPDTTASDTRRDSNGERLRAPTPAGLAEPRARAARLRSLRSGNRKRHVNNTGVPPHPRGRPHVLRGRRSARSCTGRPQTHELTQGLRGAGVLL